MRGRIVLAATVASLLGGCGLAGGGGGGGGGAAARVAFDLLLVPGGLSPVAVRVADLDGDGALDLCALDRAGASVRLRLTPRDASGNPDPAASTSPPGVEHLLVWDTCSDLGVADVDRDGRPDLVCCDAATGALAWFRQDPEQARVFLGPQIVPVAESPSLLFAQDVDGNGGLDLLCLDAAGRRPVLYREPFGPAPGPTTLLPAPPGVPGSLAVGDLDRDGLPDCVAPLVGTSSVAIWTQDRLAPGTFALAVVALGGDPLAGSVAIGDLDGDGLLDLAVDTTTNRVETRGQVVPLVPGTYEFELRVTVPTGSAGGVGLDLGDLDGDGRLDLVVDFRLSDSTGDPADLAVHFGAAGGGFDGPQQVGDAGADPALPDAARGRLAIGDLDGDGDLDLVACDPSSGALRCYLADLPKPAGIAFAVAPPLALGAPPAGPGGLALGDLDRDGRLDLALACDGLPFVEVHFGDPAAPSGFSDPQALALPGPPSEARIADLDRDGLAELVCPIPSLGVLAIVHRDLAARAFLPATAEPSVAGASCVAVGDFDRDGRPDLAVCAGTLDLGVHFQAGGTPPGTLAFDPLAMFPTLTVAKTIATGDLDGDGRLDLVTGDPDFDLLVAMVGDPLDPRGFLPHGSSPLGGGGHLRLGDLNRDGALDLAIADPGGVTLKIDPKKQKQWLPSNFRLGLAMGGGAGLPPLQPSLALADLDRDGRPDLVCTNPDGSGVTTFLQARDADPLGPETWRTLSFPHLLEVSGRALVIGDLDRDGRPDLVTAGGVAGGAGGQAFAWRQVGGPAAP
jgi:hypothetical protein